MTDHVLEAARKLVSLSLAELRAAVEGLPVDALNWQPTNETNSIAVLVAHTLGATRLWLCMAVDAPLPERDREAEFRASVENPAALMGVVDEMSRDCMEALESVDEVDWSAMRETKGRGGDAPPEVPAAYAVIHVTEHLRGHVDQVSLVRQLWEAR